MLNKILTNRIVQNHLESSWIISSNNLKDDLIELKKFINFYLFNETICEYNPDFYMIEKAADARIISIEQIRKLQDFLCKTSFNNSCNKVAIIYEADLMNLNAANACLKILEEPTEHTYIFLLTTNINNLISTIISRCSILDLIKLATCDVTQDEDYLELIDLITTKDMTKHINLINELKNKNTKYWLIFCKNINLLLQRMMRKINNVEFKLHVQEEEYFNSLLKNTNYLLEKFNKVNKIIDNSNKYDLDLSISFLILLNEIR